RLMRKREVSRPVLQHVGWFITGQGWLHIQKDAAVGRRVMNRPDDYVLLRQARRARPERTNVDGDVDAEVLSNPAERVAEIVERHLRILAAVRQQDVPAMPPNQLVQCEV